MTANIPQAQQLTAEIINDADLAALTNAAQELARSTVFQIIRLIVVPFEEKPAQSFSAKQER
jgi:hypothetical protein